MKVTWLMLAGVILCGSLLAAEGFVKPSVGTDLRTGTPQGLLSLATGFHADLASGDAWKLQADGSGSTGYEPTDGYCRVTADAGLELAILAESIMPRFRVAGGIDGDPVESATWHVDTGASLTINGFATSATLGHRSVFRFGADPGIDLEETVSLSQLAGEMVLKPFLTVTSTVEDGTLTDLSLTPGLGLSWYPGFPLSLAVSAGWEEFVFSTTGTPGALPVTIELAAIPVKFLCITLYGEASFSARTYTVDADLEVSLDLGSAPSDPSWFADARIAADSAVLGDIGELSFRTGMAFRF